MLHLARRHELLVHTHRQEHCLAEQPAKLTWALNTLEVFMFILHSVVGLSNLELFFIGWLLS